MHFNLLAQVLAASWASIPLLLLLPVPAAGAEIIFFYSPVKDVCEWGGSNAFPATNNTADGGLCAYAPGRNRLYACPAPDPTCWGFNINCSGGSNTTPGPNQISCGVSNGDQWCCDQTESCTTNAGQVNVCIASDFKNPNAGVSPADARAKEFSALPSASIGTNLPNTTPSAFSTLSPTSTSTSKQSSSSSSSAQSSANANNKNGNKPSSNGSGLSGGAIAGIVVGVVIGALIIAGLILLFLVRRHRRSNDQVVGPNGGVYEKPQDDWHGGDAPTTAEGAAQQQQYGGYYAGEVYAKHAPESEAGDAHLSSPPPPPPQEPQELPATTRPLELP